MNKIESAHEESIWSCAWGQHRIEKAKEDENQDPNMDESTDTPEKPKEYEIHDFVVTGKNLLNQQLNPLLSQLTTYFQVQLMIALRYGR